MRMNTLLNTLLVTGSLCVTGPMTQAETLFYGFDVDGDLPSNTSPLEYLTSGFGGPALPETEVYRQNGGILYQNTFDNHGYAIYWDNQNQAILDSDFVTFQTRMRISDISNELGAVSFGFSNESATFDVQMSKTSLAIAKNAYGANGVELLWSDIGVDFTEFHTYRIQGTGDSFEFYVDDVFVAGGTADANVGPYFFWGDDWDAPTAGATAEWDWVQLDIRSVPGPGAALTLLAGLGLLGRRSRFMA